MKQNSKVYSKTIEKKDDSMQTNELVIRGQKLQAKRHFASVGERVAQSSTSFRNFKYEGANEAFPNEPRMRCVDQYYPYAVGGELLVDSPVTKTDEQDCERKAKVLKKMGYRYLVVKADMDEYEAMEQLESE